MVRRAELNVGGLLIRFLINAVALGVAALIIPGIEVDNVGALALAAVIFGVVNAIVKPILAFITCPLIVLTLGLFLLILNAAMMGLTSWIAGQLDIGFRVESFGAALLGAIIVGVVSWILTQLTD